MALSDDQAAALRGFDDALAGCIEAALWADLRDDEVGDPMDGYDNTDLSEEAREKLARDLREFCENNAKDVVEYIEGWGRSASDLGHDFWLTKQGHGVGFWDRGLGELGDRLTKATKPYGGQHLFVDEDGKIHIE